MSTGEVLNAIDRALRDLEVSPDAMRSRPAEVEPVIESTWQPPYVGPPIRIRVRPEDFAMRPGALVPDPAPYPASRRRVVPLLVDLAGRVRAWLLRRNR